MNNDFQDEVVESAVAFVEKMHERGLPGSLEEWDRLNVSVKNYLQDLAREQQKDTLIQQIRDSSSGEM